MIISRNHFAHSSPSSAFFTRRAGLTLMELLIGLAITAVVSGILAILMNATAVGTNSQQDGRRALVRMESMKAQIGDALANSRCILAAGSNYVVFWTGDQAGAATPTNNAVNLSEIRLLEVDTVTGNLNLWAIQWPGTYSSSNIISADSTYAANTPWYSAAETAKSNSYFTATPIATGVSSMTVALDSASPTQAKMVNLVVSFSDTVTTRQAVMTATLPNQLPPS